MTTFFYIWIDQFIPLLLLRFFHGLSFGVVSTATGAIAADVIPPERRGAGLGYFAMAMNLAVVAGPFVGLSLLQFVSFQTLFIVLSILMIAGVVFSVIVHVPHTESAYRSIKRKFSIDDLIEMKAIPIGLISCLVGLAYASILSYISVYSDSLGLSEAASYFFLIFAIVMLLTRPYFGRTYDIKGPNYVILPCLMIFAIGLVSLSFTDSALMLLVSAGLIGLGYGTLLPSFQTMAIQTTEPSRSGHATATFFIFYDSGIAIGSFVWGIVVAGFGYQNLYIFCAVLVLVIIGLFILYQTRKPKQSQLKENVYTEVSDIK